MDKSIRVFRSHDEMKAEEYRYWRSRPAHERMEAVTEITLATYAMRGEDPEPAGGPQDFADVAALRKAAASAKKTPGPKN